MNIRRGLVVLSALVLLLAQVARAADSDVSITFEKKRVEGGNGLESKTTEIKKTVENWQFVVTVQNQRGQALQGLDAKYIIFFKTEKLGDKGNGKKERKTGDYQIASIAGLGTVTFNTDSVTLTRQSLIGIPGGYTYYANGAKPNTEDSISGVWVRLYDSHGNLFAEGSYPEDLTSSEQWQ
jgi:hypothetical protein